MAKRRFGIRTAGTIHRLFNEYAEYVKPQNILELTLLTDLVDTVWLIRRYGRHQTIAIERWYQDNIGYQANRSKSQQEQKQQEVNHRAAVSSSRPADIAELVELDDVREEIFGDCHEVQRRTTEIAHNRALDEELGFQEELDRLINSAFARFNKALQLLEHCRTGLGQILGEVTAKVIDAEYNEVEAEHQRLRTAPPIAGPETQSTMSDEHTAAASSGG